MEIQTITLERWMCRICLEKGTYNIFDDRLLVHQQGQPPTASSSSSGCSNSISIIEALNYFGEFKITKPETIDEPIMLCESCHAELARCVEFRRKLNDSEVLLHKDYAAILDTDEEVEEGKTGLTMQMVDIEPFLEEDEPELSPASDQEPPKQQTKIHHAKPRFQLTSQVSNILRHVATTSNSSTSTSNSAISFREKRKECDDLPDSATPKKIHRRDSQDNQLEKTLIVPNYVFTREVNEQQEKNVLLVEKTTVSPEAGSLISCESDLDRSDTDEVFYCKHCPKAFSSRYHLVTHTKNVHLCQYCLKHFGTILARNKHIREEHKSFRCSLCSFQSRYATNLRAHLRKMHSVVLPAHVSILQQPQDVVAGNK